MPGRFDQHAAAVADTSWILRTLERGFTLAPVVWQGSVTRAWIGATLDAPQEPAGHRVRLAGCAALSAAIVRVLLVGISHLLQPPMDGVVWLAVAPVALVCICAPRAVVAAWSSSRISRIGR